MITIKTPAEIAVMRRASQIVAEILAELAVAARPGVMTEELDQLAEQLTYKKGAKPAFKGYKPGDVVYPKTLCVSVNNEIVHGIPSSRKLKSGEYRLYSRKKNPKTGKRRNLGTFKSKAAAEKHERAVQYFKRAG